MKLQFFFVLLFCGALRAAELPRTSFFVANEGQWEAPFAFRYDGAGGSYYLTSEGMTIDLRQYERSAVAEEPDRLPWDRRESRPEFVRGHVIKVKYLNANTNPQIVGEERLPHYSNYFLGSDSCHWRSFVGHYRRVTAKNVWQGVDIEYRIEPEGIESVYHLAAGVDPAVIQVQYDGLDAPLRIDSQGNLILQTSLGVIREKAPYACQVWQGKREEVAVAYQVTSGNTVRLMCAGYDRNIGMVIDPLLYSSFWGSEGIEYCHGLDILSNGCIVVGGKTDSPYFPTTPGAYQEHWSVVINSAPGFLTELTPDGDSLVFSTYLAGQIGYTGSVLVSGCPDGSIWTSGYLESPSTRPNRWPLTADALDTTWGGGSEGYYTHLSADGSELLYSSYLGGSALDVVWDFTLDSEGRLILVGETDSDDFPVTTDAFAMAREAGRDGFFMIFDPVRIQLDYSTYVPGNYIDQVCDITVSSPSVAWIGGFTSSSDFRVTNDAYQSQNASGGGPNGALIDAFIMKWDLAGHQLQYSSYLGGSGADGLSDVYALDANRIVLAGVTRSADFPVTSAAFDTTLRGTQDGFISLLQIPDSITTSTFVGGGGYDAVYNVYADSRGVEVVGYTTSDNFPVTPDAYDTVHNNEEPSEYYDIFISRLSADLSRLEYSTYLGGGGSDEIYGGLFVAMDTVWLFGRTGSSDFPITANAVQSQNHGWGDVFFTKFAIPDSISPVTVRPVPIPLEINLTVYPNPFNSTAQITFTLPTIQRVSLRLYDVLGREAATLLNDRMIAGEHRVSFDGGVLSSGVYFCRMEAGRQTRMQKVMLMK